MARHEIRPLTGLRGIAAVLVAVYHLNGPHEPMVLQVPGLAGHVVAHGYLAVDMFFVLSGYVMALSYAEMVRRFSWSAYLRFLIRRIARVYPLYIALTLAIGLVIATGISHEALEGRLGPTLLWNTLLVQSWWGAGISLDGPAWSVSAEFAAYVIFPLLATFALFGSRRTAWALLFCAVATVAVLPFIPMVEPARGGPLDIYVPGLTVLRCVSEFCLGLLTFRLAGHAGVRRVFGRPAVALALSVGLIGLMMLNNSDVAVVALFPPLVLALAVGSGPVQRLCASAPIFLLGELSYAIYLLHTRFVRFRDVLEAKLTPLAHGAAPVIATLIMYALLLLVAWIAFRGLERPARAWVRKAERLVPSRLPEPGTTTLPGTAGH